MFRPVFLGCAICMGVASCSTVPITGRNRVNVIPDSQILPMSFQQYDDFLKEHPKSKDAEQTKNIKAIGKNISQAVDAFMRQNDMGDEADSYEWEFNLIEDETVNAWCMPGGKVVFYSGILPIAKNTDGIAAIMGHEVAHAFAKHGQERMTSGLAAQLGGVAVAIGTSGEPEQQKEIWNVAYGVGSGLGMLKFSRLHEEEADKLGLVFMIMAGYDPEESIKLWERMKASKDSEPPEFFSTHPSNDSRIKHLQDFLPEAKKLAKKYKPKTKKLSGI